MRIIIFAAFICSAAFLHAQTVDAQGRRQGYWKKKDEKTGKLQYEGEFKDNKPVGVFRYYYPHDSVRAIMNFRPDGKSSYARLFHLNGKLMAEGVYQGREVKDSTWTYYDEFGLLVSRETFKNGKRTGKAFVYTQDGKISEERNFKDDVMDGKYRQFYDGTKLRCEVTYVNGKQEGKMTFYYAEGGEASSGFYKNGLRNGPWISRNREGVITKRELYKNGSLASKKETDEFFRKSKPEPTPQKPAKPAKAG